MNLFTSSTLITPMTSTLTLQLVTASRFCVRDFTFRAFFNQSTPLHLHNLFIILHHFWALKFFYIMKRVGNLILNPQAILFLTSEAYEFIFNPFEYFFTIKTRTISKLFWININKFAYNSTGNLLNFC